MAINAPCYALPLVVYVNTHGTLRYAIVMFTPSIITPPMTTGQLLFYRAATFDTRVEIIHRWR